MTHRIAVIRATVSRLSDEVADSLVTEVCSARIRRTQSGHVRRLFDRGAEIRTGFGRARGNVAHLIAPREV